MYTTEFGDFDGDKWEVFIQKCLKIRYRDEGYQSVEAHSGGDLGIEGFTRNGLVFQCYCPDENYDPTTLYQHQRKKVTDDLKKLVTYRKQLETTLSGILITKWILITPRYFNKDLLVHCAKKRNEYRTFALPHLHSEFDVLVHDIDFYLDEARTVLEMSNRRLRINAEEIKETAIREWSDVQIEGVKNTIRKLTATFPQQHREQLYGRILKMTDRHINDYLKGNSILERLQRLYPDQYERFELIIDDIELDVERHCNYPVEDNRQLFDEIEKLVDSRLKDQFGQILDLLTINDLRRRVISDWLIRCPIDFIMED